MKMLCPWGHLGTLSPEQHLLRAAMFLWISVVFFPRVLEARWLQVGFLWFCSVSETQTPLSCQIPHNTAVLAGRELPAINRGSLALHGEHQALLLTWGTPSTEALLRTPLGCARSHPTAVSAWLGQPDLGFGTHSPAVSPHAGLSTGSMGSSSPPSTPFCLHYFDMLYSEDVAWAAKGMGETSQSGVPGGRGEVKKEPEQCPIIDSQGLGLGGDGELQGELPLEEHSLEQMQSMVVGEVLKDIETACKLLNIAADPADWSPGNVQKWILWTEHQYRLPQLGKSFQELSGKELCAMSEEQFCQRSPVCGDVLHAHLDIWKSAAWMKEKAAPGDVRYCGSDSGWADSEVDSSCAGQPIHLWQFLKELLLKPHNYGRFIRWLNKEKGIFKIEDSAQVARLWGIRKNRPAMNYDKLSRSIRQYYKKGIIRKPDISQRLVYQFVHPL